MENSKGAARLVLAKENNFRCEKIATIKMLANCIAALLLLTFISCRKNANTDNTPLTSLDVRTKDFSLNKHSKIIKGSYGVLTTDQRFESTDIIQLRSGTLLAILGNSFDNPNRKSLFKSYSYDNGVTWSTPENINLPYTGYEFTACNIFRRHSRLYLVMNRVANCNGTFEGGIPAIAYSDDEGATWTKPKLMLKGREKEIVIINSRNITITQTGRIIIPITYGQFGKNLYKVNVIYSDNNARSWVEPQNSFNGINTAEAKFAEPSIAQLKDGRLIMLIRTSLGHIYKSYSSDNGTTWSVPECTPLVSPWTAHSMRITKHGYMVLAYTNSISRGDPGYPRNNLKFAVSYDNGQTWKPSGTILEIPESHTAFIMEPNITFLNNDKYLVTFYRQTNSNSHRIETAIFDRQAVLRDEENWADLKWWLTSGSGIVSATDNNLHLSSNTKTTIYKSQILSGNYTFEFRSKINSFVTPGNNEYSTLGLKITDGTFKLALKIEADGIYVITKSGEWVKYYVPMFLNNKNDWHLWKLEVANGKAKIFIDELNVINEYELLPAPDENGSITYSTNSNSGMRTDWYLDYSYYDPL